MDQPLCNMHEFPAAEQVAAGPFSFSGPGGRLAAGHELRPVDRGRADSLDVRVAEAFRCSRPGAVIGGALPFRRMDDDFLWCSQRPEYGPATAGPDDCASGEAVLQTETSSRLYGEAVSEALRVMDRERTGRDPLRKIVLARTLAVIAPDRIAPDPLMARLGEDPSVTAFKVALPARSDSAAARWLVGATPELLLEKRAGRIQSYPLAGSARRSHDPVSDAEACSNLARSEKDRREHAMVVEYILDTLSPWCRNLGCPEGTGLTCTRSMWHLGTRIVGDLKNDTVPSVILASALHPTPAVCGLPRDRAAALIDRLEPVSRDFYAGVVGWCNQRGDGAWQVAIRCAELSGNRARLFAGAGIVPGSDPDSETAETGSKFAALLRAFGLPGDAALELDASARLEEIGA
ncbi:isochorismate synthase [Paracoccus sp. MBLB3053]|uniref:isochorismate synthase n=1 Tax=Paracoccus aurantius TaxID=3073814 RepID=A0ABU2I014_9RHOB|nr:isochorismate synthase [Paracoccus sp. MBLB3053]MDS9469879.1 isochorismate synthase [Paracoccus sp. MBLB3053]